MQQRETTMEQCHCGAQFDGSDHCNFCFCEQFEAFCDAVFVAEETRDNRRGGNRLMPVTAKNAFTAEDLLFNMLLDGQREVNRYRDQLMLQTEHVERVTQRVRENVERGRSVNALGELQQTGHEFDRLCAVYQTSLEWQRDLARRLCVDYDPATVDTNEVRSAMREIWSRRSWLVASSRHSNV